MGSGSDPRRMPRAPADAHQKVHPCYAEAVHQREVDVVTLRGHDVKYPGRDGRAVSRERRIDVIETRAAIPQRVPAWMRPMIQDVAGVGNEGAFDRHPVVEVRDAEPRKDE